MSLWPLLSFNSVHAGCGDVVPHSPLASQEVSESCGSFPDFFTLIGHAGRRAARVLNTRTRLQPSHPYLDGCCLLCSTLVCVGTSLSGRAGQLFRLDRFLTSASPPFASRLVMAHFGASSADAAALADFAAAAGLDVTTLTTSPTTTAPGLEAEVPGPPTSGEPEAEAPPSSGGAVDGDIAVPPISGEPALVEPTAAEEDISPPVMGVPSSSEDEEELLADHAGAPFHPRLRPGRRLVPDRRQGRLLVFRGRHAPSSAGDCHSGPVAWEPAPIGRGATPGARPATGGCGAVLGGRR